MCSVTGQEMGYFILEAFFPADVLAYTQQQQPFYSPLSRTTRVSRYQKKHSSTHHPAHHPIFISFFHLPRSIASSLFKLCTWQSFCTTSLHVLFNLPLGLEPSTSYSIHFFTQSVSSKYNLLCCRLFRFLIIPFLDTLTVEHNHQLISGNCLQIG